MFGAIIPLIAKIGIPIVANLVGKSISSTPQNNTKIEEPQPSIEKLLSSKYDVKNMSRKDFSQLLSSLDKAGVLTSHEVSQMEDLANKIALLNESAPNDKFNLMALFTKQSTQLNSGDPNYLIAKKTENLLKGLDTLRHTQTSFRI